MATSNIKKNAKGYGYNYTDLAEIHNYLESQGITYYQYTETVDGADYIMTVPIIDGKEQQPRKGCRIIEFGASMGGGKQNIFQMYGSALTYLRRYSLLMCFGLATTDDDAACFTTFEPKTISKSAAKTLADIAQAKGLTTDWLLERCRVTRLGEITDDLYAEVMHELEGM